MAGRDMTAKRNIGFIGLGTLGEPMARRLLQAGHAVIGAVHTNRASLERLLREGLEEAPDAGGVAAKADFLIVCVPDAPQGSEVLFGPAGVCQADPGPRVIVDMSTISPVACREFGRRLQAKGHRFIDAPVSGGPARAGAGTLAIMVGASDTDFAAAQAVLTDLGSPTHVGPLGMGQTVKLVNQVLIANIMIANAEALTFAKEAGADIDVVRKVIATATGSNYLLENWLPKTWFAGTFEGGFALDLLRKDLNAALEAAREIKVPMPASALAYQLYTAVSAKGDGRRDYSAVAKFYECIAGHEIPGDV
ncbi:MAG: 2-hydroxy-3-oxopropionate reductase [Vulcanimicrobiaceae bacterium]